MVVIAGLAYYLSVRPGGLGYALPMLGVLVLAAQRMLPLMQTVYNGWILVAGNAGNAESVLGVLEAPPSAALSSAGRPLPFDRDIVLSDVSFGYSGSRDACLSGLNLTIRKGAKIGIIGETGSGKSTLADLLMGLLHPTSGSIFIDGELLDATTRQAWQAQIAHVPQAIFLADGSIAENIAFGVPPSHIDLERVKRAAQQSALAQFVEGLPDGYATEVGERGIRLSGGERQRIGIARALYRQAAVLFLDEATSALDVETERVVIDSIRDLDLTMVIIAHRLTTIEHCDAVVTLQIGQPGLIESAHPAVASRPDPAAPHDMQAAE